jgi:PAS domain S-box-containing protein
MNKDKIKRAIFIFFTAYFAIFLPFSLSLADTKTKQSKENKTENADSLTIKYDAPAKKIIRVAVLRDLPPLYVSKKDSEKPTGFAIDLLDKLSQMTGFKVKMVVVESWEDAINSLRTGDVDLIPGIAIIEKRKKEFIYSDEIVSVPVSFFVRVKESSIENLADLAGKKVAVIAKSAAGEALLNQPSIITILMPNIETLLVSLLAGEVDAVLCPEYSMIKKASDIGVAKKIQVLGEPFFHLKRAYQFRKEDYALRDQVNEALKKYLQTEDYLYLYQKWYEPEEFWIPLRKAVLITMIIGFLAILTALLFFIRFLRAKKKLVEQNIHFQTLFDTMSLGVVYHTADGRIISANPAAEKILGLSFEQMRGKTSIDPHWRMICEDGTEVPGEEHPGMIALRTGQKVGPVVRGVFHTQKNTHIWLSITSIPLFEPGETKPFQVYSIFDDITERRQADDEFRRKTEQLDTLNKRLEFAMEVTKTNTDIIDADFNVIYADERWQKIYGNPQGKKCYKYFMGADKMCPTCAIPKALKTKKPVASEEVLAKENNRIIEVHTIPYQDTDGTWKVFEFNIDITKRKQIEKEISQMNTELERRVAERTAELAAKTAELERTNKVFVDREMRMRELKKRIAELEKNSKERTSGKDK